MQTSGAAIAAVRIWNILISGLKLRWSKSERLNEKCNRGISRKICHMIKNNTNDLCDILACSKVLYIHGVLRNGNQRQFF